MQCQRVILLVLGLVCLIHAMPTLQYKLLSEKTGQFVKLHSNGQVTADALRVGKCVEVCYSVLCVVLAFTWSPSLSLLLFFFFFGQCMTISYYSYNCLKLRLKIVMLKLYSLLACTDASTFTMTRVSSGKFQFATSGYYLAVSDSGTITALTVSGTNS